MSRDGDQDGGDDDVLELQLGVARDEAEQIVARMRPPVRGQRQELRHKCGRRGGPGTHLRRIGQRPKHPDDHRRHFGQQLGGVWLEVEPLRDDPDRQGKRDAGHEVELDVRCGLVDHGGCDRVDAGGEARHERSGEHVAHRPPQALMYLAVRDQHGPTRDLQTDRIQRGAHRRVGRGVAAPPGAAEHFSRGRVPEHQPSLRRVVPHHVAFAAARLVIGVGIGGIPWKVRRGELRNGHGPPLRTGVRVGGPTRCAACPGPRPARRHRPCRPAQRGCRRWHSAR